MLSIGGGGEGSKRPRGAQKCGGEWTKLRHGLLRFRTNDVLGTSGVGVCISVVSNSPVIIFILCYIGHHVFDLLSHEPIPGRRPPPQAVKVAGSKPAWTLILFFLT